MDIERPSGDREREQSVAVPAGWASGSAAAPSHSVQATIDEMTVQMRAVIDAAERAAEAIRLDAEDQARRHLAEAQRKADRLTADRVALISDLTDDLIRHAANVREHSEQMVQALEDAVGSFAEAMGEPKTAPGPSAPFGATPGIPTATPSAVDLSPGGRPDVHESPPPAPIPAPIGTQVPAAADRRPTNGGGTYTDIIGAPPPPPPATAPAPAPAPERPAAFGRTGEQQPTEEAAEAAAAAHETRESEGAPDVPLDVVLYATRRAANGVAPEVIASEIRLRYGIEDPAPIIDRVIGRSEHPR